MFCLVTEHLQSGSRRSRHRVWCFFLRCRRTKAGEALEVCAHRSVESGGGWLDSELRAIVEIGIDSEEAAQVRRDVPATGAPPAPLQGSRRRMSLRQLSTERMVCGQGVGLVLLVCICYIESKPRGRFELGQVQGKVLAFRDSGAVIRVRHELRTTLYHVLVLLLPVLGEPARAFGLAALLRRSCTKRAITLQSKSP